MASTNAYYGMVQKEIVLVQLPLLSAKTRKRAVTDLTLLNLAHHFRQLHDAYAAAVYSPGFIAGTAPVAPRLYCSQSPAHATSLPRIASPLFPHQLRRP
jgi:hypothetical protein